MPTVLKRLAWQSLVWKRYFLDHTPVLFRWPLTALPIPNPFQIQMPLLVPEVYRVNLTFDRQSGSLTPLTVARRFMGHEHHVTADQFDLLIAQENGRGPAVYAEILTNMWQTAIQKRFVTLYEDDQGFCITPNLKDNIEEKQQYMDFLFNLGFISGLCVARGLYLPFPLHIGFWRFLCMTHDDTYNDEDSTALSDIFLEKFTSSLFKVSHMPELELQASLCLTDEELYFQTRDELVCRYFLPDWYDLSQFQAGWQVFMSHIPMHHYVSPELNHIFCEPTQMQVTVANFLLCCQAKSPQDELFFRYVHTLQSQELETLVFFITGKKRLPFWQLGEDKITIHWQDYGPGVRSKLPIAQNCTNSLILPCNHLPSSNPTTLQDLQQLMQPIFHYETVYGFA
jgi:hypothetical protein